MAKLKGGTEAMISGKVGGLVFFDYFGERHVRLAPNRRKKNSWSPKQVAHRKRFSAGELRRGDCVEDARRTLRRKGEGGGRGVVSVAPCS